MLAARRRPATRHAVADRSLEALPVFRLSDSADDGAVAYSTGDSGRWRVLAAPGERLPGTFDQDVYVELLRRYQDAGRPADGAVSFTLHAFLRSMARRVDGRTYEQLRAALSRLQRTTLESAGSYFSASAGRVIDVTFSLLSHVAVERRRMAERDQLALFPALTSPEPGVARVTLSPLLRENIEAGHATHLALPLYMGLGSPVARRLYRLIEVARSEQRSSWQVGLDRLAEQLPLAQRFPSHVQRVLRPAHDALRASGVLERVAFRKVGRERLVEYVFGTNGGDSGSSVP
jgi:plasmid replication initiation protein